MASTMTISQGLPLEPNASLAELGLEVLPKVLSRAPRLPTTSPRRTVSTKNPPSEETAAGVDRLASAGEARGYESSPGGSLASARPSLLDGALPGRLSMPTLARTTAANACNVHPHQARVPVVESQQGSSRPDPMTVDEAAQRAPKTYQKRPFLVVSIRTCRRLAGEVAVEQLGRRPEDVVAHPHLKAQVALLKSRRHDQIRRIRDRRTRSRP